TINDGSSAEERIKLEKINQIAKLDEKIKEINERKENLRIAINFYRNDKSDSQDPEPFYELGLSIRNYFFVKDTQALQKQIDAMNAEREQSIKDLYEEENKKD